MYNRVRFRAKLGDHVELACPCLRRIYSISCRRLEAGSHEHMGLAWRQILLRLEDGWSSDAFGLADGKYSRMKNYIGL
jgi:hypothetical protein